MGIDYTKRGLRLGYLIRGRYHDSAGASQTLRLSGPWSRVGTGYVGPDPDEAYPAQQHHWRSGTSRPTMIEDLGKLDQHIAALNRLALTVALDYPQRADSEAEDTSRDGDLRAAAVSGRWTNRAADLWLVDLDTTDTDQRMRATWDRDATGVMPGSFKLTGKELPGILGSPWKSAPVPYSTGAWTPAGTLNAENLYRSPSTASSGRGFQIAPQSKGKWLGSVFGYDAALGATGTSPAPVWRRLVYYGATTGYGVAPMPAGMSTSTEPVFWFWVSPQYGCSVGVVRAVDDDGVIHESGSGILAATGLIGHNYDASLGPLGTFCAIQFDLSGSETFTWDENSNAVYARIHGPPLAGATTQEWSATYGEPFTRAFGTPLAVVENVWDVMDLVVEDADYLNEPALFGTTATADFASDNPSAVTGFAQVLAAVPQELTDEPITYREALTGLVAGLPADLVWKLDPAVDERRLFPLWRGPRPGQAEDYVIRVSDLAALVPRPSIRQESDPSGEYSNETTVNGPDFIDQPSSVPFPANDVSLLERKSRFERRITDVVEQGPTAFAGVRARKRTWNYWSPKTSASGDESARYLAAEVDQPQVWVEAELGGEAGMRLALGDLVRYQIHGVTSAIGQIRRLEFDLEGQIVTVNSVHITEYAADAGGGD